MIRIYQIKRTVTKNRLSNDEISEFLLRKSAKILRVAREEIAHVFLRRHSLDARIKPEIRSVYTVDVVLKEGDAAKESRLVAKLRNHNVCIVSDGTYRFAIQASSGQKGKIAVVGFGPAGLFAAYMLARAGFEPVVLERGADVDRRVKDVETYWKSGTFNPGSNVQFGEGGAGTFSDGKLTSSAKDTDGRRTEVLKVLASFGAPEEILYEERAHIGTDRLRDVVKAMREDIRANGGEVCFDTQVTGVETVNGHLSGLRLREGAGRETMIAADAAIVAIGHSARDTFSELYRDGVAMEAKAYAVGLRVIHPQEVIDIAQYGGAFAGALPHASYHLSAQTKAGRGVYTFCMCPGGQVIDASSEVDGIAVNGMSAYARDSGFANSAVVVQVTPEDYRLTEEELPDALRGIAFQRELERRACRAGGGKIPVSTYDGYRRAVTGEGHAAMPDSIGKLETALRGRYAFAELHTILPDELNACIVEGMTRFGQQLKGFDSSDALLAGVESRTSSPVRMPRTKDFYSTSLPGLFPCGEGAGYAGGILSAAIDGIKCAEAAANYVTNHGIVV